MGMSSHPSFGASLVTFMDSPTEDARLVENAMGSISGLSKFTIHLILLRVFEYGILWSGPENAAYKGGEESAVKPSLYHNISLGLGVMLSIVKMLGEELDGEPFYPEIKTYWPRKSFRE
jgi:hypothetical protein